MKGLPSSFLIVATAATRLTALFALTATLWACHGPESIATRDARQALAQLAYPAGAPYGPPIDIAAQRQGKTLHLYNRTPAIYRDHQLWLNRQYVNTVPVITIGTDNIIDLPQWVNRYAEPFPVGQWLTPDDAKSVVLAELYDPQNNQRHRLTLWPDDTEDDGR